MANATTTIPTQNTDWGFWGTMGVDAPAAWPIAFRAIRDATTADADATRAFLDSRHGRHFADEVRNHLAAGADLADAIAAAATTWMSWTIGRRLAREIGIPAGLPYLTGYVHAEGHDAEMAA